MGASTVGDIIDNANEVADLFLQEALDNRAGEAPPANGFCHFCAAPIARPQRWCDADCRADWEKEQWARKNAAVSDD